MDTFDDFFPFFIRYHRCLDGTASGGQLVDNGNIQVCEQGHGECPGNRCRGHNQLVGLPGFFHAFFQQGEPLVDTETVLLVDNDQADIAECNLVLEQRVGSDHNHWPCRIQVRQYVFLFIARLFPCQKGHRNTDRREPLPDIEIMLVRKYFRRGHQGNLVAGTDNQQGGDSSHHGLAGTDIALDQPQHRRRFQHVLADFCQDPLLRARQFERQVVQEGPDPAVSIVADNERGPRPDCFPDQAQAQVVRQQFLENQALLGRMVAVRQAVQVRIPRRPVYEP